MGAYKASAPEKNVDPARPGYGPSALFWPGAVGADTDISYNGKCPREIRLGTAGTLAVVLLDGTALTLATTHLATPLQMGDIQFIKATGSTGFNILCLY